LETTPVPHGGSSAAEYLAEMTALQTRLKRRRLLASSSMATSCVARSTGSQNRASQRLGMLGR
jgi:hypothetical protein